MEIDEEEAQIMGDMGEMFRDMNAHRRRMREKYGVNCPECPKARPKAHPTILLPGQRCKVDGYKDPRKRLTNEDYQAVADELWPREEA